MLSRVATDGKTATVMPRHDANVMSCWINDTFLHVFSAKNAAVRQLQNLPLRN
jgi:hypothetical protein